MKNVAIDFLPAARADILEQYVYLLEHATEAIADRLLHAAELASLAAARNPQIGTPVLLEHPTTHGLRSWPLEGFPAIRLYYLQREDSIRIIRVLHGKRDLEHVLPDDNDPLAE